MSKSIAGAVRGRAEGQSIADAQSSTQKVKYKQVMELDSGDEFKVIGVLHFDRGLSPQGWIKRYVGYLTVDEIRRFAADDDFAWLEVQRPADLRKFRNGEFDAPPHKVPAVLAYTAQIDGRTQTRIGEGRGRINFARAHDMRLHVWCLNRSGAP
jgi:hypothetical protein